jgi:DNA-binding response OmpR family regulator
MADSAAPEAARLRLLVVEDEALIGMMLEDMIEELGHHVVDVATSVRTALRLIATRKREIDAALVDANLGGASAAPVVAALQDAEIPFVLASGYEAADLRQLGIGEASLRKPYRLKEVEVALNGLARAVDT